MGPGARGQELTDNATVLVPMSQRRRMQASARPTLKDLLLSDEARTETLTPARRPARRRPPPSLG
jgi:hypothetical protein